MDASKTKGFPIIINDTLGGVAVWYLDENGQLKFEGFKKDIVMNRYIKGYETRPIFNN